MNAGAQTTKALFFLDLERELNVTRQVLDRLPEDRYDWKPHEKSMSLGRLAQHVATLPDWMRLTLEQDELDAAAAPRPSSVPLTHATLLEQYDRSVAALQQAVAQFDVTKLDSPWTMRNGAHVIVTRPKSMVYRLWSINHLVHHRAQLCVYLRLLNVQVPTVYFNTADDPTFKFD